jgi:hypothetical protein
MEAFDNPRKMMAIVRRSDLLKLHGRKVEEEIKRERFFVVVKSPPIRRRIKNIAPGLPGAT